MTYRIVKVPMYEVFLDKKTQMGAHFRRQNAEAVKRKLEELHGYRGRLTVLVTEVYVEASVVERNRLILPGAG